MTTTAICPPVSLEADAFEVAMVAVHLGVGALGAKHLNGFASNSMSDMDGIESILFDQRHSVEATLSQLYGHISSSAFTGQSLLIAASHIKKCSYIDTALRVASYATAACHAFEELTRDCPDDYTGVFYDDASDIGVEILALLVYTGSAPSYAQVFELALGYFKKSMD